MHFIDIIFLCVAGIVTAVGIWRGLIVEAFRFLSVVTGFVAATTLYRQAFELLAFLKLPAGVVTVIAFACVFLVAAAVVLAAGWAVKKVVHLTVLAWVDRLAGGAIGFVKCLLIAWAVSVAIAALPLEGFKRSLEEKSLVYTVCSRLPLRLRIPGARRAAESIEHVVKQEAISAIPDKLEEFKAKVDSVRSESN